jgi:NAD(P)-dependent dehydrogenase (short-subunit alcohol dehydrogenase family)
MMVSIVTGAAGGLGKAIGRRLAERGDRLLLADIDKAGVEAEAEKLAARGFSVTAVKVDVAAPAACRTMAETALAHYGRIDAIVHAAGIDAPPGRAWEEDDNHWRNIIDVDLSGAFWVAKAVLPSMLAQKSGRIIFLGSVAARAPSADASAAYNAAKAGINGLAIGLSAQVEAQGVRVNVIAPGPTGTGVAMSDAARRAYQAVYPLGEGGTAPVVAACLYLLGEGGDWVSGSVLNVSGGRLRG